MQLVQLNIFMEAQWLIKPGKKWYNSEMLLANILRHMYYFLSIFFSSTTYICYSFIFIVSKAEKSQYAARLAFVPYF